MNRRKFLGMLAGGVAASAAVRTFPFRVFSFPNEPIRFYGLKYHQNSPALGAWINLERSFPGRIDVMDMRYWGRSVTPACFHLQEKINAVRNFQLEIIEA